MPISKSNVFEFGVEFQYQLIAEIIADKHFGYRIIDLLESHFFKNQYISFIVKLLKEYYVKHESIPNYVGLEIEIDNMYGTTDNGEQLKDTLKNIREVEFNNANVQEIAMKFCKFQRVRSTVEGIQKQLNKGAYEDYDEIEESVRKAITFKDVDESVDFHTDIESALKDDYREPIPTGIDGIDEITKGGIGKGELAVIIAPLGVGKTTLLSLISSNAYLEGKNVLHIFFEDKLDEVRRKYLAHWSNISLEELNLNREIVLNASKEVHTKSKGNLRLVKLPSEEVTTLKLRKIIKKEKNRLNGILDLVIIDYADCIAGENSFGKEEWSGEGKIMRSLENMADEFGFALWTAVQGGRASTTASLVQVDMMGGNIKKAQVAHFIMSVAKTLDQKEMKTATIAILKSRFGDDGKVFDNCTFNNNKMLIDTTTAQSALSYNQEVSSRTQDRVRNVMAEYREEHGLVEPE